MELVGALVVVAALGAVVGLAHLAMTAVTDVTRIRIALKGSGPRDRAMMARATPAELAAIAEAMVESGFVSRPAAAWLRRRYSLA